MEKLFFKQEPDYISVLMKDFLQASKYFPDTEITHLAESLINGARQMDARKVLALGVNFQMKVTRNPQSAPEYEHAKVPESEYADNSGHPLNAGEKWNEGRRATATGQIYKLDSVDRPVNPYMETGLNGRGVLGRYGPNHAVDNGMIVIKNDEKGLPSFYALGILRKYDDNAPALAGGFVEYSSIDFSIDLEKTIDTRAKEFFEEAISGSVELLPEFSDQIEAKLEEELSKYSEYDHEFANEKRTEIITALRLEQVRKYDPQFLVRLREHIASGHECFAGPVLNDPRNTNTSWIESRLSWVSFDEASWSHIKGDDKFSYELTGGDDASAVVHHKLSPEVIEKAYASHGPMMCFMAASYALEQQSQHKQIDPNIIRQLQSVSDFFQKQRFVP